MRAIIQRVTEGAVAVAGREIARIGKGYVILVGVKKGDTPGDARSLAKKCAGLRVMDDRGGKMNLDLALREEALSWCPQFTLYADTRRGNRPGFGDAAPPEEAAPLFGACLGEMKELLGPERVQSGEFRAMMSVRIVNDGPVTVLIECPTHNNPGSVSS